MALGVLLAKFLTSSLRKALVRSQVDKTLISFLCNVSYYSFVVVAIVIALSYLGVPTTSLVAVLGAATLAIGLALQDSIANLASGVSIIALRPIAVGDYVEIADDERVAKQPPAMVAVKELGDNSVNLTARPYVNVEDEPDVTFAITEEVKLRFDKEGVSIPFPQRAVHLFRAN